MRLRRLCLLLLPLLVAACAANKPRFPTEGINAQVTPQAVTAGKAAGQAVLWGGVIINSSNLANATQVEVLAYPLGENQRPDIDRPPSGRFLAVKPGYLETADFAPGRLITIRGEVTETTVGKIGQADYTYPVVRIEDSQLWKRESVAVDPRPRVSFGFGVMIGH